MSECDVLLLHGAFFNKRRPPSSPSKPIKRMGKGFSRWKYSKIKIYRSKISAAFRPGGVLHIDVLDGGPQPCGRVCDEGEEWKERRVAYSISPPTPRSPSSFVFRSESPHTGEVFCNDTLTVKNFIHSAALSGACVTRRRALSPAERRRGGGALNCWVMA